MFGQTVPERRARRTHRGGEAGKSGAGRRLAAFNSEVEIVVRNAFISRENMDEFFCGADVILDATDSMPARFLINDFAVANGIPWVYTGVSGVEGTILPVLPGKGPCLRCLFPKEPKPAEVANCSTGGILPVTPAMAVSIQIGQALRILSGTAEPGTLIRFNVWDGTSRVLRLRRSPGCPCCGGM